MAELDAWFESEVHKPTQMKNVEVTLVRVRTDTTEGVASSSSVSAMFEGSEKEYAKNDSTKQKTALQKAAIWLETIKKQIMELVRHPCATEELGEGHVLEEKELGVSVINIIAQKAYSIGADFLFRVNDDTVFFGRFAKTFHAVLSHTKKPYGIVGPCSFRQGGNNYLLQHHFVHRTHMDIFGMNFYPPGLEEWWTDQWMSRVYGPQRTFISKHIGTITRPATRNKYIISNSAGYIASWVNSSRQVIHRWLEKEHRGNLTVAEELKRFYSGIGNNVMTAVFVKPEFHKFNLECSSSMIGQVSTRFRWCLRMKNLYDLEYVGDLLAKASRITSVEKANWKLNNCTNLVMDLSLKKKFSGNSGTLTKKHPRQLNLHLRPPLVRCTDAPSSLPLIAVMAATTSRKIQNPSNSTISLMTTMLPSLIFSLDCGFRYVVVLGFDSIDDFYSSVKGEAMLRAWFETNVGSVMRTRGVDLTLELVRVVNPVMKPGPVFLEIAKRAYAMGSEFMYRVNDDTEVSRGLAWI